MKEREMTLNSATSHVRSCRWFINPNPGFRRQLVSYQNELKKSGAELKELVLEKPVVELPTPVHKKELPDIKKHTLSPQPVTSKHFLPKHAQGVIFKSRERPVVPASSFIDDRRKSCTN